MNKLDLSDQEIESLYKKIKDQSNQETKLTPKEKFNQALFNRTWNPETMPAEKLREFQSHGWFLGYEPRELSPEQAAIEEEEFQSIVNEAFPSKQETSIDRRMQENRNLANP